jgi:hypothetical protein
MSEQPRDHRERVATRIAGAVSRLGLVVAVGAWLTWGITAFLGYRLPLLDLRTSGGIGAASVWLFLVGPLFSLVIFIAFRLLATMILGIALIALRHSRLKISE